MFKKYLSALLALAMLACAMPTTVLSETTEEEPQAEAWVEIAEPAVLPMEEAAVPEAEAPAEVDAPAKADAPAPEAEAQIAGTSETVAEETVVEAETDGEPDELIDVVPVVAAYIFEDQRPAPESIAIKGVTIGVGQVAELDVQVLPENAETTLTFATSAKKYVDVSEKGFVKGVHTGSATIQVTTDNGLSATCTVKVVKAPSSIKLNTTAATLGQGESLQLAYTLTKGTAAAVTFASSDANVAAVDANGLVRAIGPGTATVAAATHNGKTAKCEVTVLAAPTAIELSAEEIDIGLGETAQLTGRVNEGASGQVTFFSNDANIATVTEDGTITGVAVGRTQVVATTYTPGVYAWANVNVLPVPESVEIPEAITLGAKDAFQLVPEITEGTTTTFTYASSKKSVATVSEDGLITARARGTANITVTTANGKRAVCKVTVVNAPKAIKLNAEACSLGVGETFSLDYALTKNTEATVTYASSDPAVASVDASTGLVRAIAPGAATITATTHNGVSARCQVVVGGAPAAIELSATEIFVGVGLNEEIEGAVNDGAFGKVYFSSMNDNIAEVSADGEITGVSVGTTEIIATTYVLGVTARARVTVLPVPESVQVTETVTLGVKDTFQLEPVITEGTTTTYIYSTSKKKVATVSPDGLITAVARGTANITVTTANGKTATCKVSVVKAPKGIELAHASGTLGVGETYALSYSLPKDTAATIQFESSDPSVVAIDEETGLMRALQPGQAVITATTHNGKSDHCTVTVYAAPTAIVLSADTLTLGAGATDQLEGSVNDGAYGRVYFTSLNDSIATVDADGTITAVAPGTVAIVAYTYVEGVSATAFVTVTPAPTFVRLPAELTLGAKDTFDLNGVISTDCAADFAFASSKTSVATVSEDGVVTARAKGSSTITVMTYNGLKATCKLKVLPAPSKIVLSQEAASLGAGETLQLNCKLSSGTAATVRFASSDESVATVDAETGLVTAVSGGQAVITATTHNGLEDACQITVIQAPTSLSLSQAECSLGVGETVSLEATLSEGSFAAIDWSSSNVRVATVDGEGTVSALAVGTAVVSARTYVTGVEGFVVVNVRPAPQSFELEDTAVKLASCDLYRIVPVVADGYATTFTYASSDSTVASVDENGLVTAGQPGTAKVTVTSHNGKSELLIVNVYDPYHPSAIAVGELPDFLTIGQTCQVEYTFEPQTAGREMIWSSTDPAIATVSDTGLITAVSPGLSTITGVSRRNSELRVEYMLIVLSETRALTIPEQRTAVDSDAIQANLERIRAIEGSAYAEVYALRANGAISEAEYARRIAIIKNAFSMYAFPWVTTTNEPYWNAANSVSGLKDFKTGVVYYGVPYTGNTKNRTYNTTKLVNEGYYKLDDSGDYYVWDTTKFSDRDYKGSDCSGFAGIAYYGTTSRGVSFSSASFSTDSAFKTIPWDQPMRAGDLLVASHHHVAIFLYYVDAAKTQIMIIDQGGGDSSTNSVSARIRKVSYYTERNYIIRRLVNFNN